MRGLWLGLIVAGLLGALGASSAEAEEARGGSAFCLAIDDSTNTYYYSDTFPSDPRVSTAEYEKGYGDALRAKGRNLPLNCKFTDLPQNIPVYLDQLRQQCSDCAVYSVRKFAWSPNSGDAEGVPDGIAAPLPSLDTLHLDGEQNAFVQVHNRFFACKGQIRLSYSLRPVPERGIDAVPYRGTLTIEGRPQRFDAGIARHVAGHTLGCDAQSIVVGELSSYEDKLKSGTFSDGKVMWTRTQMIEQLLGRMHIFSIDHVPLQDVQPRSPTPAAAQAQTPEETEAGAAVQLNQRVLEQNAAIDARNKAAQAEFQRQQDAYNAARARYEAAEQKHRADVAAAEAARTAYEQQLKDYERQHQGATPAGQR